MVIYPAEGGLLPPSYEVIGVIYSPINPHAGKSLVAEVNLKTNLRT